MRFIIGYTNLSRMEMFHQARLGKLNEQFDFQKDIWYAEDHGWTIIFETSLFRRLFLESKYRVVAIKP